MPDDALLSPADDETSDGWLETAVARAFAASVRAGSSDVVRLETFARTVATRRVRSRRRRIAVLTAALLAGLAGTSAAIGPSWFRIGGIGVSVRDERFAEGATDLAVDVHPTLPGNAALWPGEPVTVAEATRRSGDRVRLPRVLRAPASVFWMTPPARGQVTAVWAPSRSLPRTRDPKVGLLLTQFRGHASAEPVMLKKSIDTRSPIETVDVNGVAGIWVSGAHTVHIVVDGEVRSDTSRVSGSTLLWAANGLTFRLEGAMSKAEALRIVRSVR